MHLLEWRKKAEGQHAIGDELVPSAPLPVLGISHQHDRPSCCETEKESGDECNTGMKRNKKSEGKISTEEDRAQAGFLNTRTKKEWERKGGKS